MPFRIVEENLPASKAKFKIAEESPQTAQKLSEYRGGISDLIRGKAEKRPVESLIEEKGFKEIPKRLGIGAISLLESLAPGRTVQPGVELGLKPSTPEILRGDVSGLPREVQEAGEQLETLGEFLTPIPMGTGEKAVEKLKPIAESSKLKIPRLAEKGTKLRKLIKPTSFKPVIERKAKNLLNESERILKNIKQQRFPIAKQIEKGKPIQEITEKMFKKIESDATKIPIEVSPKPIINKLKQKIKKFSKARIPATTEQKAINQANLFIDKLKKGDLSYSELISQYRANNKSSKNLIEKLLVEGSNPESLEIYQSMNNEIAKIIQRDPNTSNLFKQLFKKSNKNWEQLKKIDQFEAIFKNAIDESGNFSPKKFSRIFEKEKTNRQLTKILGEESVNQLKNLSEDLKTATDALNKISPLKLRDALVGAPLLLKYLGIPGGKPLAILGLSKKALDIAFTHYLMSPRGEKQLNALTRLLKQKDLRKAGSLAIKMQKQFEKETKKSKS